MTQLDRLMHINEEIKAACARAGRSREDVRLLAASKTQSVETLQELGRALQTLKLPLLFGENRIQEAKQKVSVLGAEFHCIGHLQKNKVKDAWNLFSCIQSLDSETLAQVLQEEGQKRGDRKAVLVQVNISNDGDKGGFAPESIIDFVTRRMRDFSQLEFRGLMTITRFYENPEDARGDFRALRGLADEVRMALSRECPENCRSALQHMELSMGMSQDFAIAIEEGSTIVRLGTSLFGERIV